MLTKRHTTAAQREQHAAACAALVRRVVDEVCDQGDLAVLDAMAAMPSTDGLRDRPGPQAGATLAETVRGRLRALLAAFRAAVPDARWTILEQVSAGETVVTRLAARGRFSGPLLGLAPPGRPATLTGVAICRFEGNCLVELWLQADLLGLLQQLGLMPPLDLAQAMAMAQVQRAGALLEGTVGESGGDESGDWVVRTLPIPS